MFNEEIPPIPIAVWLVMGKVDGLRYGGATREAGLESTPMQKDGTTDLAGTTRAWLPIQKSPET